MESKTTRRSRSPPSSRSSAKTDRSRSRSPSSHLIGISELTINQDIKSQLSQLKKDILALFPQWLRENDEIDIAEDETKLLECFARFNSMNANITVLMPTDSSKPYKIKNFEARCPSCKILQILKRAPTQCVICKKYLPTCCMVYIGKFTGFICADCNQ
jgi:hypothetical protein